MNAANDPEVEWRVRRIPLEAIRVDPTVQQRASGTSQDVVDEYAEAMRNGIEFPPIDVSVRGMGRFISATAFTALTPICWRIPMQSILNVEFTPEIVTMRFFAPAAQTRSTACRAAAPTS